jgi:hypothetical protein
MKLPAAARPRKGAKNDPGISTFWGVVIDAEVRSLISAHCECTRNQIMARAGQRHWVVDEG